MTSQYWHVKFEASAKILAHLTEIPKTTQEQPRSCTASLRQIPLRSPVSYRFQFPICQDVGCCPPPTFHPLSRIGLSVKDTGNVPGIKRKSKHLRIWGHSWEGQCGSRIFPSWICSRVLDTQRAKMIWGLFCCTRVQWASLRLSWKLCVVWYRIYPRAIQRELCWDAMSFLGTSESKKSLFDQGKIVYDILRVLPKI